MKFRAGAALGFLAETPKISGNRYLMINMAFRSLFTITMLLLLVGTPKLLLSQSRKILSEAQIEYELNKQISTESKNKLLGLLDDDKVIDSASSVRL
ncbi:MAG: hypothetical protein R3A50_10870 [Saprospiraceae bacterium]